ncbi:uncharacterized protein LOC136030413 [Artemia franciscana]|uniref:uncharacterized protein LOC136030413 n=1 Tax=Artemia franciscana TaxID=6661 RepID=UPI0032DBBB2B
MPENRILWEAKRLGYFPPDAVPPPLANIYSVLSKLKGLKEGNYLLSNEANAEGFYKLWETTADKTPDALDIYSIYSKTNPYETDKRPKLVPWLPIDVETVTFSQKVFGRIPGTFEPERGPWKQCKFRAMPGNKRRKKKKIKGQKKVNQENH